MKKFLKIVLASALLIGTLAGCASNTPPSSPANATDEQKDTSAEKTDTGEQKVLDVVWFSDGKEGESFKRLAEKYEAENPNIKIELIEVPFDDLENKIRNMINGKQAPAMARLANVGAFRNQLMDLGEYVSDKDAFISSFNEGLRFVEDGKVVAAPMDVTANGLIYNKTAFEQAGVEVPKSEDEIWTWDEWKVAMQQVVENSDCTYGLVYDKSPHRFSTLLFQAGGGMLSEDLTKSNFNTDANKRAVEFFKELHDEKIIPDSVWLGAENPNNLFRTGQIAMHFSGSWMISNYQNEVTDFDWGVTYLPKEAQRSSVPGGKYLAGFEGTGVEQETADFIEWISKAENNAVYCEDNNFLSQVKGNEALNYEFGSEFFEIFAQELAASTSRPGAEWGFQAFTSVVQGDMRDGLIEVLAGQLSVEDYLSETDALFTEALEDIE